jgi:hypothetical protein
MKVGFSLEAVVEASGRHIDETAMTASKPPASFDKRSV